MCQGCAQKYPGGGRQNFIQPVAGPQPVGPSIIPAYVVRPTVAEMAEQAAKSDQKVESETSKSEPEKLE